LKNSTEKSLPSLPQLAAGQFNGRDDSDSRLSWGDCPRYWLGTYQTASRSGCEAGGDRLRSIIGRHSLDSKESIWRQKMTLFSSTILYRRIAMPDRRISSDVAFGVWASVGLIGLAIVSVTLGVAPVVDPTLFPAP
jgi:hypothetical protein